MLAVAKDLQTQYSASISPNSACQGFELTSQQKAELLALAEDLPRLWQAKTTSARDRKRMLRLLIKDVTVEKRRNERKALLHIRWQGGALEDLSVDLPLPMPERLRYCETILTSSPDFGLRQN